MSVSGFEDLQRAGEQGEDEIFAVLYKQHYQRLFRYCQYRLRDRHEAEDAAQEAFVRAWRSLPMGRGDGNFYPWLRVVAGNLCTDTLRKRGRSQPAADVDPGAEIEVDHVGDEIDRQLVRQALERLNARHRTALMLREDEGLTYDQIAQRTGVTAATVESLLWRARQALKREFTVLAGREGCLGVMPVLAVLALRLRKAPGHAYLRLVRRVGLVGRGANEMSATHAAMAAVLGLALATVVAASGELGSTNPAGHRPALLQSFVGSSSISTRTAQSHQAKQPTSTSSPASALSTAAARSDASSGRNDSTVSAAKATHPAAPGVVYPGRVINPVSIGKTQAGEAKTDPISVTVGPVTVGLDPSATAHYAGSRLGALPVTPATPAAGSGIHKETTP